MARKKITNKTGFDDYDFNFDQQSDDMIDDFNFDFDADTDTDSNRSPIDKVRKGASATLSSTASTFIPGMKDRIREKMPDAGKFVSDVGEFTSDMKYLSSEFQRDLAPSVAQLKRAGRVVGSKVKFFLPKKLHDSYDRLMSDTEEQAKVASVSKDKAEDMSIASSIDSIFNKNLTTQLQVQEAQHEDDKTDTLIDRNLSGKRHEQSFLQLQAIRTSVNFQQQFTEAIHIPYLKKDLELKYRHFYATRDMLTQVKGITKILEDKLEQVRHNTALPDFAKLRTWESAKEKLRDRTLRKIGGKLNEGLKGIGARVKERVIEPLKDMVEMGATGADIYADINEGDDFGPKKGIMEDAGGFAGGIAGGKAAKFLSKKLFGTNTSLAKLFYQWNDTFKNLVPRLQAKAKDAAFENEGTVKGLLYSLIGGDHDGVARVSNTVAMNDPDEAGVLTNQAVLSITTIMPGYLAKMTRHLETLATGKPAEELIYDTKSNDFISSSLYQKQFMKEAVGDRTARSARLGKMAGTIKGMYKDKDVDFSNIEQDITTFLNNLIMNGRTINPEYIANFAGSLIRRSVDPDDESQYDEDLDSNTDRWIQMAYKGVKDPAALTKALMSILFYPDQSINKGAVRNIDNLILADKSYATFQLAMQKAVSSGGARHLNKYIKKGGGSFTLDDEAISTDMLANENEKTYESNRGYAETHTQEHMNKLSEKAWDELKKEEGWENSLINKLLKVSNKARTKWYDVRDASTFNKFDDFGWDGSDDTDLTDEAKITLFDRLRQAVPGMFTVIDSTKSSIDENSKKLSEKLLAAEKRRKERLLEDDDLDPYAQARIAKLKEDDDPSSEEVVQEQVSKFKGSKNKKTSAPVFSSNKTLNVNVRNLSELADKIKNISYQKDRNVKVTNISEFTEGLKSIKSDVPAITTETTSSSSGTIAAIVQFENTFKKFAEENKKTFQDYSDAFKGYLTSFKEYSSSSIEFLQNLPSININTTGLSAQFDALLGTTRSTVKGFWNNISTNIKSAGKGLGEGLNKFFDKAPDIISPLTKGLGEGFSKLGGGIGSFLSGSVDVLKGTKDLGVDTIRGVGTKLNNIRINGVASLMKKPFVDIFRKQEVDPERPLVTALDQINGKIIDSVTNKPIESSYSITNPLLKVNGDELPMIVVTKEDIEHGLVNIHGQSLSGSGIGGFLKKTGKLAAKGIKKPLNMLGDLFKSDNPVMKMYGRLADMGLNLVESVGSGLRSITRRIFGPDKLPEGAVTQDALESIVGVRLDTVISLLEGSSTNTDTDVVDAERDEENIDGTKKATVSDFTTGKESAMQRRARLAGNTSITSVGMTGITDNGASPGDKDGDGKADTIFEDRANADKEEADAADRKLEHDFYKSEIEENKRAKSNEKKEQKGFFDNLLAIFKNPLFIFGAAAVAFKKITDAMDYVKEKLGSIDSWTEFIPAVAELLGWEGAVAAAAALGGVTYKGYKGFKWLKRKWDGTPDVPATPKKGWKDSITGMFSGKDKNTSPKAKISNINSLGNVSTKMPTPKQSWMSKLASKMPKSLAGRILSGTILVGGSALAIHSLSVDEAMAYADLPVMDPFTGKPMIDPETGQVKKLGDVMSAEDLRKYASEMNEKKKAKVSPDFTPADETKKVESEKSAWEHGRDYLQTAGEFTGITDGWNNVKTSSMNAYEDMKNAEGFWNTTWAGAKGLYNIASSNKDMVGTAASALFVGTKGAIAVGAGTALKATDDIILDGALQRSLLPYLGIQTDDFLERRCSWYGVHGKADWNIADAWKRVQGKGNYQLILELEDITHELLLNKKPFTLALAKEWTSSFGFNSEYPDDISFWITWYKFKFVPIVKELVNALVKVGVPFDDRHKLTNAQKNEVMSHIRSTCTKYMGPETEYLNPVKSNLDAFKKRKPKMKAKTKEELAKLIKDKKDALNNLVEGTQDDILKKSISPSIDPSKQAGTLKSLINPGTGMSSAAGFIANKLTSGGAVNSINNFINNTGLFPSAGGTNNIPQANPQPQVQSGGGVAIGEHMKKFESGDKGSAAIGYDVPGGTSYGSYQIISKRGKYGSTMDNFIDFCKKEAPEVYKALYPLRDQMNTMSKKGPAVDTWQELVNKGHITRDLERKFFIKKFWKPGLANLKRGGGQALHDFIVSDRALQEFAWSSFVALGVGGASSLFKKVYKPGMTPEQFLDQAGAIRYSGQTYAQFIKHHPGGAAAVARRGKNEIALLKKLIGQPPMSVDGQMPTGNMQQRGSIQPASGGKVHPMPGYNGKASFIRSKFKEPRKTGAHGGIDLDVRDPNVGKGVIPVYAYMDGKVEKVESAALGKAYGNVVFLAHADGNRSIYAHLDNISPNIKPGMKIGAGTELGKMGTTGRSTGPHLHFEISKLNNHKSKVDPSFVTSLPGPSSNDNRKGIPESTGEPSPPKSITRAIPKAVEKKSSGGVRQAAWNNFGIGKDQPQPSDRSTRTDLPSQKPINIQDIQTSSDKREGIGGDVSSTTSITFDKDFKKFAELIIMLLQQLVSSNQEIPLSFNKVLTSLTNTPPKPHQNASPPPVPFEGKFVGTKAA